jgi:hypothetical protein
MAAINFIVELGTTDHVKFLTGKSFDPFPYWIYRNGGHVLLSFPSVMTPKMVSLLLSNE